MIVLKFGGSSIKNADHIKNIYSIVKSKLKENKLAIVFSAMSGITNKLNILAENSAYKKNIHNDFKKFKKIHNDCLLELCNDNSNEILEKHYKNLSKYLIKIQKKGKLYPENLDNVLSFGEILSTTIIANYFTKKGIPAEPLNTTKVILTDNNFGKAYVHYEKSYNKIRAHFKTHNNLQIITGFIGSDKNGKTTTLGRNGSDYTASIIGAAINANSIEIWSDVNGVLSTNPKITKDAKVISKLSNEEAMELAHAGAEVLFPPSIIPALYKNIQSK